MALNKFPLAGLRAKTAFGFVKVVDPGSVGGDAQWHSW